MAQYVQDAEELKPLIQDAKFTPEQMNVILKMMKGCKNLRQSKVIESFWLLMVPESMEIKRVEQEGKYGKYFESIATLKEIEA